MKRLYFAHSLLIAFVLIGLFSCQKDDNTEVESSIAAYEYSAEVPLEWFRLFELIDRYAPGYRPPAAARALGYIGFAGYEAAVNGMPAYQSLAGQFNGLLLPDVSEKLEYHWPTAVNAAYHVMFQNIYPHIQADHLSKVANLNQSFENKYSAQLPSQIFHRSKKYGEAIANAIFTWSATDGPGHEAYLDPNPLSYLPPTGPGLWQPTTPDFTPGLFPYWGEVRTFAMKGDDLLTKPPLVWSDDPNSSIYQQAKETQIWVNNIKAGNDEEHHWIAEFWSDDFYGVTFTPAGRWIAIASQVVDLEQSSLETAVRLYAQMGMALCDAGVAAWKSKYTYNYERPVDYIHRNFDGGWKTIMNNPVSGQEGFTPNFPAYPSGHSAFGGAGASILTDVFGYQYAFTDNCHKNRTEFRGTPRSYNTFIDMAVENAYSRIPLGVHFRMDCKEGLSLGYLAGQRVLDLPWWK